ncbi:cytochrome P450 [Colletotrichum nymphaeae SA-01]|uniref:Cytochrome P450 n=1 Tax=Colletotrichum nymphaeae SA-01 TaxID=1460502 RepID=A0A135UQC7_9PEZI|nr:cytochrome P450 [Colletotrichum nymphaeae SA-01]
MPLLDSANAGYTIAALCIVFSALVLLRGLTCSITHVPGPWHTRFVNYALKYHVLVGQRMHYVHSLHLKYGSFVRISPTEVAIADPDSFNAIHKIGSGFTKGPWYSDVTAGREPGIVFMTDPKEHALRRRLLARAFTTNSLRENWEPVVREKVEVAVSHIRADALKGNADILKWWMLMTTDVIAHLSFGESFKALELGEKSPYIHALETLFTASMFRREVPFLFYLAQYLPFQYPKQLANVGRIIGEHASMATSNPKGHSANLFSNMQAACEEKIEYNLTPEKLQSEATNLIVAGSDTTSITLTYLIWAVLKKPALHGSLQAELENLRDDELNDTALERLPLLNAIIEETLRMYGAVAGNLPRSVPPGGVTLGEFFIPGGTVVETQAYTLHRDPNVFPDPERFDETRFLNEGLTKVQRRSLAPWGAGTRVCIGAHLARMELRLAVAVFFRKCRDIRLAESMTDDVMDMRNVWLISPVGHRCDVTLK